jgi:hypothetical protein
MCSWETTGLSIEFAADETAVLVALSAPWRLPLTRSVGMMVMKVGKRRESAGGEEGI